MLVFCLKKGVNAWIYPEGFTISRVLTESAKIGYEGVELNMDERGELNVFKITDADVKRVKEEADSLGLKIPSLCTGLFWKYNLASPDESVRRKGVELIKKGCELANKFDAKCLLVVPAFTMPEVSYEDAWNLSKKSILEAVQSAEDYGVYIAVENVWNRFLYSPLEFKRYLGEIAHDYVKMYFDVGNILFLGHPIHWIKTLGKYIVCVHVKDFLLNERRFVPLLEGNVPWKDVIKALREIGYEYFLNVEVSPYPGHPLKAAIDCKTALDIILQM